MLQAFISTALPIVIAIALASWANNKRLDDPARRLDRVENLLDEMRKEIAGLSEGIARLEFARH